MKTNLPSTLSLLAVVASAFLIPFSANAAALAFTSSGVAAVLWADYGRRIAPLEARADVLDFPGSAQAAAADRQAA